MESDIFWSSRMGSDIGFDMLIKVECQEVDIVPEDRLVDSNALLNRRSTLRCPGPECFLRVFRRSYDTFEVCQGH